MFDWKQNVLKYILGIAIISTQRIDDQSQGFGSYIKQRWHRYYPKFPEPYSLRINLLITVLKYPTNH